MDPEGVMSALAKEAAGDRGGMHALKILQDMQICLAEDTTAFQDMFG